MKILMVCLGNICRSPLAEGVLQHKIELAGLDWVVDSAGTGGWHIGKPPDPRSIAVAATHGIDISQQQARQFQQSDFDAFDHILVMDTSNLTHVLNLAPQKSDWSKVRLILDLERTGKQQEVPDPYYGGPEGFEKVFKRLDAAADEFIRLHS
jgi:protein-tyrosine phosphatase